MKIKFKAIAAAAVLAAVSATASATIQTGATPDLLFVAFDYATGDTYVRDLGALTSTLLNSSTTFNAPASSIFASTFAGVDPTTIQWNIVAFDTVSPAVYATGDVTTYVGNKHNDVVQTGLIETASNGGLTQLDVLANGYSFPNGEYTGSKTLTAETNAQAIANRADFGNLVSGQGVGGSQNFIKIDTTGKATQLYINASLSAFDNNQAGGYFTLTDAQGDLSWTNASVSSVPLPAAALLFVPGLLGMFGLGRRNKKLAA